MTIKKNDTAGKIIKTILDSSNVLIISHYNPDADAYGSSLGLMHLLAKAKKKCKVINESGILRRYKFIPGIENIISAQEIETLDTFIPDCIVITDCGSLERAGLKVKELIKKIVSLNPKTPIINIDHHVSNDMFGTLNYVVGGGSSTAEVIFSLFNESLKITVDAAACLLSGIMGDTGSFRYSATTSTTFDIAATLTKLGACPTVIGKGLYGSTSLSSVLLQSEALNKLELLHDKKVGIVTITKDMFAKYQAELDSTDGLVEKVRDIEGVEIAIAVRQDESIWRVSIRSSSNNVNVSNLAGKFGGGGHVQAAAFRWSKDIKELRRRLELELKNII